MPVVNWKAAFKDYPEIFFDAKVDRFYLKLTSGEYECFSRASVKRHLLYAGLEDEESGPLSRFDRFLTKAEIDCRLDYAGPLAGHDAGLYENSGSRCLVTKGPVHVEPKAGNMPFFEAFVTDLLGPEAVWFLSWLQVARASLVKKDFGPSQCLILAGPHSCGKSFLQTIITECLGGREADPYQFMTEQTPFNLDIVGAEHLKMEDKSSSFDLRSRRAFGGKIKEFIATRNIRIHRKNKDATLQVPTFRRLTCSINNEAENMLFVPPLDESLIDKITLLNCSRAKLGDIASNWKKVKAELPAFCWFVDKVHKVSTDQRDNRYGVRSYQNAELVEIIGGMSAETRFEEALEEASGKLFEKETPFWRGRASELEKLLFASDLSPSTARLISAFPGACGTYLRRLATKHPERYKSTKVHGKTVWTITKPNEPDAF